MIECTYALCAICSCSRLPLPLAPISIEVSINSLAAHPFYFKLVYLPVFLPPCSSIYLTGHNLQFLPKVQFNDLSLVPYSNAAHNDTILPRK